MKLTKRRLMVTAYLMGLSALAGAGTAQRLAEHRADLATAQALSGLPALETSAGNEDHQYISADGGRFAGAFLSSHFAQSEYDWRRANEYLARIIEQDPGNYELTKRSMVLAMGHGDLTLAAQRARELLAMEPDNSLALLFTTIEHLTRNDMTAALAGLDAMPDGDMTDFIKPVIRGWIEGGQGKNATQKFGQTSIHLFHAGLISAFLGDMKNAVTKADALTSLGGIGLQDALRAADIYAAAGETGKAVMIYEGLQAQVRDSRAIRDRISALKSSDSARLAALLPPLKIKLPAQGVALAMHDMAAILFEEGSDNSAKLFANMALVLDPALSSARILLADTLARNNRFEEAIHHLTAVAPDDPTYLESQRHAAELLAEAGKMEQALALLENLFTAHNDVESLIRIGDLHRFKENYGGALNAYNRAATEIGESIPEEYWHLLYARGMAYEREGDWVRAETDLKAALVYRPDHPYLLNYLGYGWADKGKNLEQSLELIQKAVSLRPADGFIIDSLGWVQYMMGRYEDAIGNLERAVELLPYDSTINDHLGDAYWQVGRKLEARFQWERALNSSEDMAEKTRLEEKLRAGLAPQKPLKHASQHTGTQQQ